MKKYRVLSILTLLILLVVIMSSDLLTLRKVVRGKSPSIPLTNSHTLEQQLAQDLALADARVQEYTQGHRAEVFGVRTAGAVNPACAQADCRQVEIYNFDENAAVIAIVNLNTQTVMQVQHQPDTHPGINKRLADLATSIALNHPDVIEALGFQPTSVSMAPVDGGLRDSACLTHLCVAPTFDVGNRNLWAIVDLTDEKLLRVAWTPLADNMPNGSVTFTPELGCLPPGAHQQGGWALSYEVTGTDGLRVFNASYNGEMVLSSVKLAEWHAAYANNSWGFEDYTGCGGGGGGFPISPYGPTQVLDILDAQNEVIGFEVVQDFRMGNWGYNCNYRYEQHIQFFHDGRFRVVAGAFGRDCGSGTAAYRPLVRIDVAVRGEQNDTLSTWDGSGWITETTEFWQSQTAPYTPENYRWRVIDQTGYGYYIEPGQGQFGDGGQGDNAYFYVVAHHPNEGDLDLPIIGDCCATGGDYRQGPHNYLTGESITDENLVIWYVPQSYANSTPGSYYCWTVSGDPNPETYPCFAGPMFHPFGPGGESPTAEFTHNGPVVVGETAVFTNTTSGDLPLNYVWEFGDGITSTLETPTHIYTTTNTYTVTLTAHNTFGTDTITHTIDVGAASLPLVPGNTATLVYTATNGSPISITVPGTAVTQTYELLLTEHTHTTPPNIQTGYVGPAIQLTPYQNGLPLADLSLNAPLLWSLSYTDAQIIGLDENNLQIWRWDGATWQDANTTCPTPTGYTRDLSGNHLGLGICHTGAYALFGPVIYYVYLPFLGGE